MSTKNGEKQAPVKKTYRLLVPNGKWEDICQSLLVGACRADLVRGSTRYGLSIQRLYGDTLTIQEDAGVCRYFWVESIWNVINLIKSRWFGLKNKER
jgi:hypothetical protein